jgi:hypothetical protein
MMAEKINLNFKKFHGGWSRSPRKTGGKTLRLASRPHATDGL